jgi:hypothetical protein
MEEAASIWQGAVEGTQRITSKFGDHKRQQNLPGEDSFFQHGDHDDDCDKDASDTAREGVRRKRWVGWGFFCQIPKEQRS